MRSWLRENWQWTALNLVALVVMFILLRDAANRSKFTSDINPLLVESGKWAVRFLLISLTMTPLNTIFGWRGAIKLRKSAGLWAFGFGALHFVTYVRDPLAMWLQYPIPDYIAGLGVIGLVILAAMAATSTRWAMRNMGRWWKRLHRLVYAAGVIVLAHGLLESTSSKRVMSVDGNAPYELQLYLAILIVLLVVRIPVIRTTIAGMRHRRRVTNSRREQPVVG